MAKITFLTKTLGCRVNQTETKQLAQKLIERGYQLAKDNQEPQLVIINTCVITQKGENESARAIRHYRQQYPNSWLVATGCAVNLWQNIASRKDIPADLLVNNEEKNRLSEIIVNHFSSSPKSSPLQSSAQTNYRRFIKIQDGCNHFCSYCIVPFLRTTLFSQEENKTISQINNWVNQGTKEVILSGINLSLYKNSQNQANSLNRLIKKILAETKLERLSLSSLTPSLINEELIDIFVHDQAQSQRLSTYWHLALQSASPKVLANMNREADIDQLKRHIKKIKKLLPDFNLRADILLGFPEESQADYQQTLDFVRQTGISFGHAFIYSPRPGTLAKTKIEQNLWSPIPQEIQKQRQKIINRAINQNRQKLFRQMLGTQQMVLILKETDNGWWGTSRNYWLVEIADRKKNFLQKGKIIKTKINGANGKTLTANFLFTD